LSDASSTSIELSKVQVPNVDVQEDWDKRWRKNKILQLLSHGLNQREIAQELKVHESTISRDIRAIKKEIESERINWIDHVVYETELSLIGLGEVLKTAWTTAQESKDERIRLQALALIANIYRERKQLFDSKNAIASVRHSVLELIAKYKKDARRAR